MYKKNYFRTCIYYSVDRFLTSAPVMSPSLIMTGTSVQLLAIVHATYFGGIFNLNIHFLRACSYCFKKIECLNWNSNSWDTAGHCFHQSRWRLWQCHRYRIFTTKLTSNTSMFQWIFYLILTLNSYCILQSYLFYKR